VANGHILPSGLEISQLLQAGLRRALAHHTVVCTIALAEFAFDSLEILWLVVDGQDYRPKDFGFLCPFTRSPAAFHERLVDVAPHPLLARLFGSCYGMTDLVGVLVGVLVL
jgi:hypothetical protein